LCGLSFQAENLQNIDLDMLYLERFLRYGEFELFMKTCEDRITTLHNISSRLLKITSIPSWISQWQGLIDQKERVLDALSQTITIAENCSDLIETEEVQNKIESRSVKNPQDHNLDVRITILLDSLVGALFGVRKNFEELVDTAEAKHLALVPTIDFFDAALSVFKNEDFDDNFFEAQFVTFGLVSPQKYKEFDPPTVRNPWGGASAIDLFKKIPMRERIKYSDIEDLPPPPEPEENHRYPNNFDEMMGRHAQSILMILNKKGELSLEEYFSMVASSTPDTDISALFALFVEPRALKLFGVTPCSEVIQPFKTVSWFRRDGDVLCFSDIRIRLMENIC